MYRTVCASGPGLLAQRWQEVELEKRYRGEQGAKARYSLAAVCDLHRTLFSRLPAADLVTGQAEVIVPGQVRQREVRVGQHVAPAAVAIEGPVERWAAVYAGVRRGEATLVAMAAAHQGLGWIYPFVKASVRSAVEFRRVQTSQVLCWWTQPPKLDHKLKAADYNLLHW